MYIIPLSSINIPTALAPTDYPQGKLLVLLIVFALLAAAVFEWVRRELGKP